jgi:hypothetical protein
VKLCTKCGETKPLDSFHRHSQRIDGRQQYCKSCRTKSKSEWAANHRVEHAAAERERRTANPESYARTKHRWRSNNREADAISNKRRKLRKFGLTLEEYERMLSLQEGLCKICRQPPNGKYNQLHVDHCHATGVIRGLLCHSCNVSLGHMRDDINILLRAIHYLARQGDIPLAADTHAPVKAVEADF